MDILFEFLSHSSPFWLELSLLLRWDSAADQTTLPQLWSRVPESVHRPRLLVIDEDLAVLRGEKVIMVSLLALQSHTQPDLRRLSIGHF